ncbi:MAG: hypothetical protein VCB06_01850 [Alphaproteobacteria bacterium]
MSQEGNSGAKIGLGFYDWTPERNSAVMASTTPGSYPLSEALARNVAT